MTEKLYINKSTKIYDAIVIGSGISGGWAAKEFFQRGYKTLMIERGRVIEHQKDYIGENKAPWQQTHRTRVKNLLIEQQYNLHSVQFYKK